MTFRFDEYELDGDKLELRRSGQLVKADAIVLRLLSALVREAGKLVTKTELIERVWEGRAVSENVVSVAMARLRKVLRNGANAREYIVNLHGRGYRFVRPVSELTGALAPLLAEPSPAPRREAPFVGREPVMQRLRAAVQAARAGRGNVCLLIGEAGIGETRSAEQLAHELEELGFTIVWGYCHEAGDTPPLWPWAQLVRGLLDRSPRDEQSPQPEDEAQIAVHAAELAWLLPSDGRKDAPRAADRPLAKHRVFDAILSVFTAAARKTPCVLVLEDLHRADAATLELLRYLVDPIARTNVLLIGTLRSTESRQRLASEDLAYVAGHRNTTRIEVGRLAEADVAIFVEALLDDRDGRLARAVFEKSEGNPFFMTELGRQLASTPRPDPESLTVPEAALELVRPGVLEVDRSSGGALSLAAVVGREFKLKLLSAASGVALETLMNMLDSAVARGLLVIGPAARTSFTFSHELLRAVLYDGLSAAERRRMHNAVAHALEQQRHAGESVPAAVIAYHLHAALPDSDARNTVALCEQAAEDAGDVFAYADGVRYLHHALEALALCERPSAQMRMGLLLRQAIYARIAGLAEFESLTRELARIARDQRDGTMLAHAGRLLDLHPGLPALAHAQETLRDALSMLRPEDDEPRSAALARLATCAPVAFVASEAADQVERALTLGARCESLAALSAARGAELYLWGGPAHAEREAQTIAAIERLAEEQPQRFSVQPVLLDIHRAIRALQSGELSAMSGALARAAALAHKLGSRELLWHVERFEALSQIDAGREADGAGNLRLLHRRAREQNIVASELLCVHDELVVLHEESAAQQLPWRDAPQVLRRDAADPPNVWSIKIRALAAGGLHEQARALLRSVPSRELAKLPCDRDHLGTLGALARAALTLSEREYVSALYDMLAPYPAQFAAQVAFVCEGSVAELLGQLAWALGRETDARRLLETAVERSLECGLVRAAASAKRALAAYTQPNR